MTAAFHLSLALMKNGWYQADCFVSATFIISPALIDTIRTSTCFAVDEKMTMEHKLARRFSRWGEPKSVQNIIKPALEKLQKILAGSSFLMGGHFEITAELFFEYSINSFHFLLFAQLHAVFADFYSSAKSMLTRRIISSFNRAFVCVTLHTFEK